MITGQILVYRYNNLINAKPGVDRNIYSLKDISVTTKEEFRQAIEDSLDEVPPGQGYALVKWNKKLFLCQKDSNNPSIDYVRNSVEYHPLQSKFTI